MSYIFISYSTKDNEYANQLAETLISQGFNIWIDNAKLRSSDNWWEAIVKALLSCSVVIVIMTPASKSSKWVQREVTLADSWGKPIFPILLAGENWEIFVLTQYENVSTSDHYKSAKTRLPTAEFYKKLAEYTPVSINMRQNLIASTLENPSMSIDYMVDYETANPPYDDYFSTEQSSNSFLSHNVSEQEYTTRIYLLGMMYFITGLIKQLLGNQKSAIRYFDEAIQHGFLNARAYHYRGNYFASIGDYDKAIRDYSEVITLTPKIAKPYRYRANIYLKIGNYVKAIADFSEMIRINSSDVTALILRAESYAGMGNFEGAITDYNEAIRLDSTNFSIYYHRGVVYEKKGNIEHAISDFDESLRRMPNNVAIRQHRDTLLKKKQ